MSVQMLIDGEVIIYSYNIILYRYDYVIFVVIILMIMSYFVEYNILRMKNIFF